MTRKDLEEAEALFKVAVQRVRLLLIQKLSH